MAANKPDFSLGRIDTPDVGGGLLDFADRQQKQYQIGLSNAVEADKLLRDRQRFAREQELNARADTEYNREVSGRKALQDYASKPLDISTMLGTQTKTADEALIADANRRNALFAKSLADNKITQEDIDKGRVSPELLGKLYNPALDVNASTGIQKTYESITPFREDVESRVEKDLIAQNVDPLKAKQYAQMEGQKYQSIPEYQAMLTAQAEKMTNNSKEQFKDNLELTKFNREVYKDELDKYKIKMDNLTKMMGSTGSGGTGGGGGLLGQDKSKAYDEVYSKAGNSTELASKLDAAFQVYGAKAVNNALAASGINEPVRLLEFDVGKRDASLERFDNALKNEKPLSEVQSQFGNGAPNAPTYSLPTPATVYTADSARAAAQDRVKNSVLGYLGDQTSKEAPALLSGAAKGTNDKKSSDTLADRNNNYGNIKYDPKDNWIGGRKDPNSAFVKFDTPELGARALAKTIINGSAGLTIDQYINKYAPASDNNDTKSYIADVAKALNKKPDELIKSEDVPAVMKAIGKREGGNYSDDVLKEGYRLAVNPTTQDKDMLSKVMERNKKDSATSKLLQSPTSEVKYLFNKVDYKNPSSVELRGQMDELNKQGINTKEDELAFNNLQEQYKAAKTEEIEENKGKPFYKMSAPELINSLLGVKTEDKPNIVKQVSDEVKLANNPNAANEEVGLEDRTLDFIPLGRLAKAKGLKSTTYDKDVFDAVKANTKSGGLNVDNKILDEIYGNSPLAVSKNISEFNKPIQKMTSAVREELINYATQLRSIKNPTLQQEEMLSKINETLRNSR